jgi:hypothetical protein
MVTSKLTSVVRIIYNSTRPPPSPANPVSACHSRLHSSVQRQPSSPQFLIANLELEFRLSAIRINELKFSNRKFLAILRPSFRILSRFELQVPSLQNLIENTPLRFRLTHTKISLLEISNRERMAISHPVLSLRRSKLDSDSSLAGPDEDKRRRKATRPLPFSRNTLTCRALTA